MKTYLVRDDSYFCCSRVPTLFVERFKNILQECVDAKVVVLNARHQVKHFKRYLQTCYPKLHVVSLDKWFKGDFQLNISRIFENGKHTGFYTPNMMEFETWLKKHKDIIVVDDDIATGTTINNVRSIVYKSTNNYPATLAMDHFYRSKVEIYDIVDIRDFIPGATHGGLLCKINNQLQRLTYLHPQVNLCERMKLTEENAIKFTQKLKELHCTLGMLAPVGV